MIFINCNSISKKFCKVKLLDRFSFIFWKIAERASFLEKIY
ncbi:hypothetical protein HMPREF0813_00321 [Streptococcus anginosus F0211]|uniref:Uncharacterized protein n=1 Tax=Streptococcus anginosus F0211 TaxID=706437 RepID=E6IZ40_STRAP|nr:hypothetical protein HMPREF0813_00321 [Streptococcus anginosus F0211]